MHDVRFAFRGRSEEVHGLRVPSAGQMHALMLLGRLGLGWYMVIAGWRKVVPEWSGGFGTFLGSNSYQGRSPGWLPDLIAVPYGYALPWVELLLGVLLIAGLFHRIAAAGTAFVLFTIGLALFGAGELLPRHHVMVFFPLALVLFTCGPGRFSADALRPGRR